MKTEWFVTLQCFDANDKQTAIRLVIHWADTEREAKIWAESEAARLCAQGGHDYWLVDVK